MYLKPPFNMIILGMTGCGKTYYLLQMLEREYKHVFNYIFLICPTFEWNQTYLNWKYINDKKIFAIPCGHDQVDDFLNYIVGYFKGTNSLIIIDDCAHTQDVKSRTGKLVNLGFSARHYEFSTIVITQQLTSITKPYRENISKLVTFYNPNKKDMDTIVDNYLPITQDEVGVIKNTLKNTPYSRLEILLRTPYMHELVTPETKNFKSYNNKQYA